MAITNVDKPSGGITTNADKATNYETWNSNTTTWNTETRTWDSMGSTSTNADRPSTTLTNIDRPV